MTLKTECAKRPWRCYKVNERTPGVPTLREWRVKARQRAKEAGAYTACDLCKRPIQREHRFGRIGIRPAKAWRSMLRVRVICHGCYLVIRAMLDDMEARGAKDHLPPEDYADTKNGVALDEVSSAATNATNP